MYDFVPEPLTTPVIFDVKTPLVEQGISYRCLAVEILNTSLFQVEASVEQTMHHSDCAPILAMSVFHTQGKSLANICVSFSCVGIVLGYRF